MGVAAVVRLAASVGNQSDCNKYKIRRRPQRESYQPSLVSVFRKSQLREAWSAGMRTAVLGWAGDTNKTGEPKKLPDYCQLWHENRQPGTLEWSQVTRCLSFYDEYMGCALPTKEEDVLAYIEYFFLEERIARRSLPQCLSDVLQYHELHHQDSPTKTALMWVLMRVNSRYCMSSPPSRVRTGCRAFTARRVVPADLGAFDTNHMQCCAAMTFFFISNARAVLVVAITSDDVKISDEGITATLIGHQKKSVRRHTVLSYPKSPDMYDLGTPVELLNRWFQ